MRILVFHLGSSCDCLIATSVLRGLTKKEGKASIYCVTRDTECKKIFSYSKRVRNSYVLSKVPNGFFDKQFDRVILLSDGVDEDLYKGDEIIGVGQSEKADAMLSILYGDTNSRKNIFQVYYNMAGLKWKGEGYDFRYRPRSRSKGQRTGMCLANANLREYIIDKLHLNNSRLWYVPFKRNLFRRIDEINKCKRIITDDFCTLNIALCLRKEVHFLQAIPYNMNIELFGSGHLYKVPPNIIR